MLPEANRCRVVFDGMSRFDREAGRIKRDSEVFDRGVALAQAAPERLRKIRLSYARELKAPPGDCATPDERWLGASRRLTTRGQTLGRTDFAASQTVSHVASVHSLPRQHVFDHIAQWHAGLHADGKQGHSADLALHEKRVGRGHMPSTPVRDDRF
jgi:hypothetical protein